MVEINSDCKQGKYGKNWLKFLRVMCNVTVFCHPRRPAGGMKTTDYLDLSVTEIN